MSPACTPTVTAVSLSTGHRFSKSPQLWIRLVAGIGVEGDAHSGTTVKHRSRVKRDPNAPNLRQVHLIHAELHDELAAEGFDVAPGELGENVTTRGVDLLSLPEGTLLRLGATAVVRLTGLRNPCVQIDRFQAGLLEAMVERTPDGGIRRKSGVMSVVVEGGDVRPGDVIEVVLPAGERRELAVV